MKISQIELDGFRGATKPFKLVFPENKSIVLFGNNGDGKSSITDALEWYFFDEIDHLTKEGCDREDYFNKGLDPKSDAEVSVVFCDNVFDSEKFLHRRGGTEYSNVTLEFQQFIKSIRQERIILRHHTMRDFVDKTKTQKLEIIEDIIGFSEVKKIRNELVKAMHALENDGELKELKGKLSEREVDISSIIGFKHIDDNEIISYSDSIRESLNWDQPITNLDSMGEMAEKANKELEILNRDKQLKDISELELLIPNLDSIRKTVSKSLEIITKHNTLVSDKTNVESSVLEKMYSAAVDVIEKKLTETDRCPLCNNEIDTEALVSRLVTEIQTFSKIKQLRSEISTEVGHQKSNLFTLLGTLNKLINNDLWHDLQKVDDVSITDNFCKYISEIMDSLSTISTSSNMVVINDYADAEWIRLENMVSNLLSSILQKRRSIIGDEKESIFYENLSKLKRLTDSYVRYQRIQESIHFFELQISTLQRVTELFESLENAAVERVLEALSSDVNNYFTNYLHPDDNLDEIKLITTINRGIEFQLVFHGNKICPPRKVLSESHLNSLGICLFLAASIYFNKVSSFLILDDIISSFDANHRRSFARLLREKFSDKQILLLTHDDLWFESLKNDLPVEKWMFREIGKWNYADGIQLVSFTPMSLKEEIIDFLKTNNVDTAANRTRVLIERILKEICDQLGVTGLEFRLGNSNDIREPAELISALTNYLKRNNNLRSPGQKQLFNDLRSDQLLTNIGSHHRQLVVTGLSRGDIELTLRDIEEFESLFICQECGKRVDRKYSSRNLNYKQCQCGNLKI